MCGAGRLPETALRQRVLYYMLQLAILPCTKCSSGFETAVLCTFICLKSDCVFSDAQDVDDLIVLMTCVCFSPQLWITAKPWFTNTARDY